MRNNHPTALTVELAFAERAESYGNARSSVVNARGSTEYGFEGSRCLVVAHSPSLEIVARPTL